LFSVVLLVGCGLFGGCWLLAVRLIYCAVMGKKYGFSFSLSRALGIAAAKGKISRAIGIPLTRQGRQRKIGRAAGCMVVIVVVIVAGTVFVLV